jgi:hypothetical protein
MRRTHAPPGYPAGAGSAARIAVSAAPVVLKAAIGCWCGRSGSFDTRGPEGEAERAGFEPATHLSARTRFPVALLRPLGHLSVLRSGEGGIRTLDGGIHPHNALAGRRLQPLGHFSAGRSRIADRYFHLPPTGEERGDPSTKMSLPAPPSYPRHLKPVCGYPRRVSLCLGR